MFGTGLAACRASLASGARTVVCAQPVLDGLGCHSEAVGWLLSGNDSGSGLRGLSRTCSDLASPNRRYRLNWAARGVQRLPRVLRCESSGRPPRRLLQVDVWGGSDLALLGGKGADEGPG